MPSESYEFPVLKNSLVNITILPSGLSLIDMLNEKSLQTTDADNSTTIIFDQNTKTQHDKLSTLFNTTGRERNSTGPLKQWLYEHQDRPYPNENDKQELMEKTKMSASQITIWFTNARVKMRKENTLLLNNSGKKKKEKQKDDVDFLEEILKSSNDMDNQIFPLNISPTYSFNDKQIIMAYSCLNIEQINELHHFASIYPDRLSISDCVDDHTTHLIIGNEGEPLLCPLTIKLFQSIARHLYIISYRWIVECLKQNDIIDEINYEIRGDIPFGDYHDGMRNSRLSKHIKLFQNCQFFILCNGCQNKMSQTELVSLIQLCHGSILDKFPLTTVIDNSTVTIVLCNKLLPFESSNQQQLFELSRSNGVHFVSPEWVIESIVQFGLQPFHFYEEKF